MATHLIRFIVNFYSIAKHRQASTHSLTLLTLIERARIIQAKFCLKYKTLPVKSEEGERIVLFMFLLLLVVFIVVHGGPSSV